MNKYQKELVKSYKAFNRSSKEETKVFVGYQRFKRKYKECNFTVSEMQNIRVGIGGF